MCIVGFVRLVYCIFLKENISIFLFRFLWCLFLIDDKGMLVLVMAWRWTCEKPLPEPMVTYFPMFIWVNGTIWFIPDCQLGSRHGSFMVDMENYDVRLNMNWGVPKFSLDPRWAVMHCELTRLVGIPTKTPELHSPNRRQIARNYCCARGLWNSLARLAIAAGTMSHLVVDPTWIIYCTLDIIRPGSDVIPSYPKEPRAPSQYKDRLSQVWGFPC